MTADAAMLDQQDNVKGAFTQSVIFHVTLIGGLTLYAWANTSDRFGAQDAGGAAVGITPVDSIPLPSRGPQNPVANDTESEAPQEISKFAPKAAPEPEPDDAVALLPPDRKSKQPLVPKNKLKSFADIAQNQITSKSPQAASSQLFAPQAGAGQINVGGDTTLGNRFPEYAAQIQEITRRNWRVQDVDRSVTTGPPVTIRFDLQKDGRVTNIQLIRRSNIPTLDLSVQNAVEEAHYPPLPAGFERNSVPVEFTMVLKR
jgi:TonB family protein